MVLAELADHPGVGHSSTWQPCAPGGALCAGVEEDRFLREVYPRFVASSLQLMADVSSAPPAARETSYVICEEDQAVPVAVQLAMSAQADRVERLPSSHDPQLSMPERLAEILDSAARATAGGPSSLAPEPRNSGNSRDCPTLPDTAAVSLCGPLTAGVARCARSTCFVQIDIRWSAVDR